MNLQDVDSELTKLSENINSKPDNIIIGIIHRSAKIFRSFRGSKLFIELAVTADGHEKDGALVNHFEVHA